MIKLITFDFWNTIFDSSNGRERNDMRTDALIEELSEYNISRESINSMIAEVGEYFNGLWVKEQRTPSSEEMVSYIWTKYELPANETKQSKLVRTFQEAVLIYPPVLNPGVKEVIDKLEKKYVLGVISDTGFSPGNILRTMLNNEEILHYFSYFSFSNEIGYAKPHRSMFDNIFEKSGISAEFGVHIGDIERTDVVGAKNAGMTAIKYKGDETSKIYNKDSATQADFASNSWSEIYEWIVQNDK